MQGSDVTTQVEVALPTLLPVRKLGRMQGGRDGGVFRTSRSICFLQTFPPFLLLTDKTRTALLIKKIFSAVYIFPCTHGDIPYFLLQSAVADDVGHLILLDMSSYTPPVFFSFGLFFLFWAESDDNA